MKVLNISIPTTVIPAGNYDSALLDLFGDTAQMEKLYTELLDSHKDLNVRTLPFEPHLMTNVINALKAKAGIK